VRFEPGGARIDVLELRELGKKLDRVGVAQLEQAAACANRGAYGAVRGAQRSMPKWRLKRPL
jgi:hypothetical protein